MDEVVRIDNLRRHGTKLRNDSGNDSIRKVACRPLIVAVMKPPPFWMMSATVVAS